MISSRFSKPVRQFAHRIRNRDMSTSIQRLSSILYAPAGCGRTLITLVAFSGFVLGGAAIQAQVPVGSDFQVNSYTTGYQYEPAIAAAANGDFVVAWTSYEPPNDGYYGIQARRFASDGTAIAAEFQVNSYTTNAQVRADVATAPDGHFVVVWVSTGSVGDDTILSSVQGQRYDPAGSPVGGQFQVNSHPPGRTFSPAVAVQADHSFVVAWAGLGPGDTDFSNVQVRHFSSDGSAIAAQLQANTYTFSVQGNPDVGCDLEGECVVVWHGIGSAQTDTDGLSVHGRRFAADGSTVGSEFQVNTGTTGDQDYPAVAVATDGSFVVVWENSAATAEDADGGIRAQRFASDGSAAGNEFQVNSYTPSLQLFPTVASDSEGDFVVTWTGEASDGADFWQTARRQAASSRSIPRRAAIRCWRALPSRLRATPSPPGRVKRPRVTTARKPASRPGASRSRRCSATSSGSIKIPTASRMAESLGSWECGSISTTTRQICWDSPPPAARVCTPSVASRARTSSNSSCRRYMTSPFLIKATTASTATPTRASARRSTSRLPARSTSWYGMPA